ncbi:MAG: OmpA family protein [Gammaproteobacteria bacterium]|nr:OmpA family protein [Gammaproteobacteria bacterium]MBU1725049.1 OmpA family protein [Gammaproteobacteria bacterium]MBU2006483.1 OmpA family protein [Gammaproteobacteria bacterium]
MNNKKIRSTQWAVLPILFCSAAVLAGDGGLEAPYGQLPPAAPPPAMSLDYEQAPAADVPDTMSQAQDLGAESDGFVDDATQTSAINTGYVGGRTRLGVGIDSEFKGKADLSHVFSEDENSAIIGQGYVGVNPKADKDKNEETLTGAGAKLNYHWGSRDEAGQVSHVNKVFGAYDQNEQKDKKVTVGYGQERENMFWSGSVSKGVSDKREVGKTGNTTIFEKAYDWGVGGRLGTYLADQQMRVQGGLDYEWGKDHAANEDKAKQVTLTGGVEKFFPDSPHSVNANLDVYKKSGGYEEGDSKAEVRGGVGYRYDIASEAGIWQADKMYRRVRTEIPGEAVKQPPKIERKLVKHTMELEADTFFKVDSAKLTPEAQTRMSSVVAQMRECGPEGNIRISGNTCDVGSTQHNQKLSERRANSVRDFLVKNGFPANTLLAEGLGESSPKYPNTEAERHKNRRVDVEYVCYQNEYKDQVVEQGGTSRTDPKVVWKQELIPTPPLWVRQALHNTADHKQRVDTYKTTEGGGATPAPGNTCKLSADNDGSYPVMSGDPATSLNIFEGDKDCDGNNITDPTSVTVNIVTEPQHGSVVIGGDGYPVYTPGASYTDGDSFTYTLTVTDDNGAQHTSNVATVTVEACSASACNVGKPVAHDDEYPTGATSGNLLRDGTPDEDPNGDASTLEVTTVGTFDTSLGGSITIAADGSFTFDSKGIPGLHTFKYGIKDAEGETADGYVRITVTDTGGSCPASLTASDNIDFTYSNTNPVSLDIDLSQYATVADIEGVYITNENASTETYSIPGELGAGSPGTVVRNGNTMTFTASAAYCEAGNFTFYIKLKDCSQPLAVTIHFNPN